MYGSFKLHIHPVAQVFSLTHMKDCTDKCIEKKLGEFGELIYQGNRVTNKKRNCSTYMYLVR